MHLLLFLSTCFLIVKLCLGVRNSTYANPMLPGFHPDPSCIFVPEWDNTFFCASSSFEVFPGIPIHASKDLRNWKLVSNALSRPEQLPDLAITNRSTSGIWAPAIRYHENTFYIVTTLVFDNKTGEDFSRWDNIIFKSKNPYKSSSWSDPVHFTFPGYDTSPFWDHDGQSYVTGSHQYKVWPGIQQAKINLETGKVGELINIWNGTGGLAPEGPHVFFKDDYYYLLVAEGGTGLNHMETIARSKHLNGPYLPNPVNPILSNANTSQYFQTVGHADLFQDKSGNWWGCALSTRSGPNYTVYPMGRETVLMPVTWKKGQWPIYSQAQGKMNGWPLPPVSVVEEGEGQLVDANDDITFHANSKFPPHFVFWRLPITSNYVMSPAGHPNTLELKPSNLNLTGYDGNYAGPEGQTFVGRRQTDSLFTYSVNMDFSPRKPEEEAGVSVFLTMNHHIRLGYVLLPSNDTIHNTNTTLAPYFSFLSLSYLPVPNPVITPVPSSWANKTLKLQVQARNLTQYIFTAGPADGSQKPIVVGYGDPSLLSWGFTGTLLGIYATTNGHGSNGTSAYFSEWKYTANGQIIDCVPGVGPGCISD